MVLLSHLHVIVKMALQTQLAAPGFEVSAMGVNSFTSKTWVLGLVQSLRRKSQNTKNEFAGTACENKESNRCNV